MGFFDSDVKTVEAGDPYKYFNQYYGGQTAELMSELVKMSTQPEQSDAYKQMYHTLTQTNTRRVQDIERANQGRGMLTSGPGRQALRDARADFTRSTTSMSKQFGEQQKRRAAELIAQLLSSMKMPTQYFQQQDPSDYQNLLAGMGVGADLGGAFYKPAPTPLPEPIA